MSDGDSKRGADNVELAVIGGSGLYEVAGLEVAEEIRDPTPFGLPSDVIRVGQIGAQRVAFLARHGRSHTLLPGELNYRANIFALKRLGVRRILSASAVGSLREELRPRDVVLVDQFVDRTRGRAATFFGDGIVAHVSLADPVCPELRSLMATAAQAAGARMHPRGTYLCMEGPAFSTRAESLLYRSWGMDVIGMTNLTEAKLAREAEICYATLAMVTDYDCWHEEEEDVSVSAVLDNLRANAELAAGLVRGLAERLPPRGDACSCGRALEHAILTPHAAVPPETLQRLQPLLERRFSSTGDVS